MQLFEKHGMKNIGYWAPLGNKENKLVHPLACPDAEAREQSRTAFSEDPAWKKAKTAAQANGALTSKIESTFFTESDYCRSDFSNKPGAC